MENLTNEQIIDIINFYGKCGITEETYLSKDGALDLFTLLKIEPQFDEDGNRILTPYEELEIVPKFEGGVEVPIVFAIKNRVKKVSHGVTGEFVYGGAKKSDSMEILHKFKQDYFNALAAGDFSEASRTFDFVNKLTGGKAEEVIGINYKYEMFYAKMKRQLLLDLFANFLILRIMNRKAEEKNKPVNVNKLYKEFAESQIEQNSIVADVAALGAPIVIDNIDLEIDEDEIENDGDVKKTRVSASTEKVNESVAKHAEEAVKQNTIQETVRSFISERVDKRIKSLGSFLFATPETEKQEPTEENKNEETVVFEKPVAVLEND